MVVAGSILAGALVYGNPCRQGCGMGACPPSPGLTAPLVLPAVAPVEPAPAPARSEPLAMTAISAPAAEIPDPDNLGTCPQWGGSTSISPVVRRAIDADGWPTWWHADGSLTKRVLQGVRDAEGNQLKAPAVYRLSNGRVHGRDERAASQPSPSAASLLAPGQRVQPR